MLKRLKTRMASIFSIITLEIGWGGGWRVGGMKECLSEKIFNLEFHSQANYHLNV